jgi:two-component system, OmpR family, phosphate regulon sensor histidine kinase PhoR
MPGRWLLIVGLVIFATTGGVGVVLGSPPSIAWTVAAAGALLCMLLTLGFDRIQSSAIHDLAGAVRRLGAGEFNLRVYAGGNPALTDLARAMNAASEELAGRFAHLETERRQLRAILGGMIEGVVLLDAAQNVLFVNERAAQLLDLGIPVIGKKIWETVRHRRLQQLVATALKADAPVREELDWHGPVPRELAAYVSRLAGKPTPGAVLVLHDVTELHRLERMRQDFVANVSHELKTPLTVIKVNVETLMAGAADDPEARTPFLEQIQTQSERLHALILDLLSLARIESGAATLELESVALEPLITTELDRHRPRAEARRQTLHSTPPAEAAPIAAWADRDALVTILDNLVDNALKYTPEGGRVTVRWFRSDGCACVEVEDNGIGIPEADQPRVFERFYRVDKARARELGGTGLGLSIVKHLTQAMQGSVALASEPEKGSRFTVRLPAAAEVAKESDSER